MTATRQRTRITTTLAAAFGAGVLGLAGAASAGAASVETPTNPDGCQQTCTVSVPPSLDSGLWTANDGAPRYRIDGIGFSEGLVKVVVRSKSGRVLWKDTVQTGYDQGLSKPTFHVGTSVRCDHRTRFVTARDLKTGEWTERYRLNPCIV